jgi:hypothetical protein
MSNRLEDREIEEECRLIEQEEANERYAAVSAEDWFAHASEGFEQVERDVGVLVRVGHPRAPLLRDLRKLSGLSPQLAGSRKLTTRIGRRVKDLEDELWSHLMILPMRAAAVADELRTLAEEIAHQEQWPEERKKLMAAITRRVDHHIRPRSGAGKKAQHGIFARLFAWATELPRSVSAQQVATARLLKKLGPTVVLKSKTPVAARIGRKRSHRMAIDRDWQDGPGGSSQEKAREALKLREQGLKVTRRTH